MISSKKISSPPREEEEPNFKMGDSGEAAAADFEDIFGSAGGDFGTDFFVEEAPPPLSDDEGDGGLTDFDDLFGITSDDEPESVERPVEVAAQPRVVTTQSRKKSKKERRAARAWKKREADRKRKAELEDTPFARACKQLTAKRRAARTVREVPASELHLQMLRLVALMEDAASKDAAALVLGTLALHKVAALDDFKRKLAEGGPQLLAYLANQPEFFSAVRKWLAPTKNALPALDLRTTMVDMLLSHFPRIGHDVLRESRVGGVVKFLSQCKRETARNKAVCTRIVQNWARKSGDEAVAVAQRVATRDVNYEQLAAQSRNAERSAGIRQSHVVVSTNVQTTTTSLRARIPDTVRLDFTIAPRDKFSHLELQQRNGGDGLKGTKLGKSINRMKRGR
jgi:hypothetical protein